jgi:hypothetical protein
VSASGNAARASEGDADLVLPVDVVGREGHEPGGGRRRRVQVHADAPLEVVGVPRVAEEAALETREPVDHRICAKIHTSQAHRRRWPRISFESAVQHIGAVGRQRQLEQRTREAGAGLDQGEHRPRGTSMRLNCAG